MRRRSLWTTRQGRGAKGEVGLAVVRRVKGLEYRSVAIIGCDEDQFPNVEKMNELGDGSDFDDFQLIGELERSSKSSESGSVDFSVGLLHAGHQTRDVTEAVKAEFGEKLDEQTRKTTEDRAKGAPRSLTPHEQIKLRESFRQAVSSLNVFANDLADYCAERLRTGCKWWECEVPPPIRRVLEPTAVVATGAALLTAPVPTLVVAVAVVAVVARRKRSS